MNPPIRVEWRDGTVERRVVVSGEIDIATVDEVRKALDCPHARLVVDLSNVAFIDLSGLRCLTQATEGREVVELIPSSCVERLLDLTASAHLFEIR